MRRFILDITGLILLLMSLSACSRAPAERDPRQAATNQFPVTTPAVASADTDLSRLFGRIWRISNAPYGPASGSIYVFLPNGTLLQTSCVETYRIATWAADKNVPGILQIIEDHRPAFTAEIGEATDKTLRLRKTLLLGKKETQDVTLTAVDQEFVCPDIRN